MRHGATGALDRRRRCNVRTNGVHTSRAGLADRGAVRRVARDCAVGGAWRERRAAATARGRFVLSRDPAAGGGRRGAGPRVRRRVGLGLRIERACDHFVGVDCVGSRVGSLRVDTNLSADTIRPQLNLNSCDLNIKYLMRRDKYMSDMNID